MSRVYHGIDKSHVPDETEFEIMKIQSANTKDKFSQLGHVQDGRFYDIIVQVVKEPYDTGDKFTLWVSDYTENPAFFLYSLGGGHISAGQEGDPFGYTSKLSKNTASNEWCGPFGKQSIQITCFEPHATAIRECGISSGSWVSIRNLQIKHGHSGSNLEGFLREDRGAHGLKIGILPLDPTEDPENMNPHLKEAIRRKRDYEKAKKGQLKDIAAAAEAGTKRKAATALETGPKKTSSKDRRKIKRAHKQVPQQDEANVAEITPDLNQAGKALIHCGIPWC